MNKWLVLLLLLGVQDSRADDYFWYAYPSPQAYLYVRDPVQYRMWQAQHGYISSMSSVYWTQVLRGIQRPNDHGGWRYRRECEARILSRVGKGRATDG